MAPTRLTGAEVFPSFSVMNNPIPARLIYGLRAVSTLGYLAMIGLLVVRPQLGLLIFWGMVVPLLPALLFAAPGLWRAICPMALANQTPRMLGISLGQLLPKRAADHAFTFAVGMFVLCVALRPALLNTNGLAVACLLLTSLGMAFAGGAVFRGRSGWCGTFCPLGPIQREYGHAPAVVVPNTFCTSCVACQSKCYDLSPQATLFDDVHDDDPRQAGQRRFFISMMPGMIAGYFLQLGSSYGYPLWLAIFLILILTSVGLFQFLISFLSTEPARTASVFAAVALTLFYAFAGPIIHDTFEALTGLSLPSFVEPILQSVGGFAAALLLINAFRLAARYDTAQRAAVRPASNAAISVSVPIRDASTGRVFSADLGQTLLSAMSAAGLSVVGVCRVGQCGSDPIVILEGGQNLSAPGPDEQATLARLGMPPGGRLACKCIVSGPLVIDTDVARHMTPAQPETTATAVGTWITRNDNGGEIGLATIDQADLAGVGNVVIIGNGVAGSTIAEELRRTSSTVKLTLLSVERHAFYNRMALAGVATGKTEIGKLSMLAPDWDKRLRVDLRLSTRVASIDRTNRRITTLAGETFAYDRLVLATGARATLPVASFLGRSNCFVLRSAGDALAISGFVARQKPQRALVLGGGVLGVEIAESLARAGLSVGIVHRGKHLLERNLDGIGAKILERYLAELQIDLVTGAGVERFIGENRLMAIKPERRPAMNADLFIAAIGNTANLELAATCGLETRRGIVVDAGMRTNDPSIFAIGDCAEHQGETVGLWSTGVAQAQIAAAGILDVPVPPECDDTPPILQLKSTGIDLVSFGDARAQCADCEILTAPPFATAWWRIVLHQGAIIGASFIGPPGSAGQFRSKLISGRLSVTEIDALRAGNIDVLTGLNTEILDIAGAR